MNCAVHSETGATAYCRNCGKALCPECTRNVQGIFYCEPCLAAAVSHPSSAPPPRHHSPGAAFFLGLVPGLGAVYNGEYPKALMHVAIFVGLVTLDSTGMHQPLFGLLTAFFCLYMPIEASVTATNLRHAQSQSSATSAAPTASPFAPTPAAAFVPASTASPGQASSGAAPSEPPVVARTRDPRIIGPVILVLIGTIFLLDNLGWLDADRVISHGWPLILIAVGVHMVWKRTAGTR